MNQRKLTVTGSLLAVGLAVVSHADVVDFGAAKQYPVGRAIAQNRNWKSSAADEVFTGSEKGMVIAAEKSSAFSLIQYAHPISVPKVGDAVTVSIDFTYDQVKKKYEQEVIRIGVGNGSSRLMATFNRKGWGDYDSIGMEGYAEGIVLFKPNIGFKDNAAVGTSDPLKLSMTLTRAEGNVWNIVVILKNRKPGSNWSKRWEKQGLTFESGNTDELFGLIQAGASDENSGVVNRVVSRFEINTDPAPAAPQKTWNGVDFRTYILPMQPQGPLVSEGIWGEDILPRDPKNGLEDTSMKNWCYWDGSIVKDDAGKYHMYASRWTQTVPHSLGWKENSKGMHAVSDNIMGPYKDMGLTWPQWKEGLGHNVVGLRMFDGRYAMVTSDRTRGEVFVSDGPDGPFELLGEIKVDPNGFNPGLARYDGGKGNMSNVMIIPRNDGRYMIVARSTAVMISEDGILGPYKIMSDRVYKDMPEIPQTRMEDPTAWFSGGMYHMLVNHWPGKTTYHFSSKDGIHDWKYRGIAYRKDEALFRYPDGTVDEWYIVQRPTAYTEDGHITHFNFSVIDVTKGGDRGNDQHGSKIIVVPFDGEAFDRDMQAVVAAEEAGE
ncbi:glycoside hydrolase family protein [Pontiella agarivorans]|uniref:Glycoside hydrolase family protein n=1 Tax=Pontiella agarivorans TaxID=3038953 RepID=A0ABU5N0P3_9BACT|nr:glycoside hydrolase family protein [Pontiella agarivorans]MDZ8120012.1 glycoside hydrolase family protein [Pontiella agarivorans]